MTGENYEELFYLNTNGNDVFEVLTYCTRQNCENALISFYLLSLGNNPFKLRTRSDKEVSSLVAFWVFFPNWEFKTYKGIHRTTS